MSLDVHICPVCGLNMCLTHFDKWWDENKFDWDHGSWQLPMFYSSKFKIWWNPDKFNWRSSHRLAQYCARYIKIWWNPNKFEWRNASYSLAKYCCRFFDIWWDEEKFNWKYSWALAEHCSPHFRKWWNPDKYDNREISIEALILFCAKYEADWKYFVLYNTLTL